MKGRLPTPRHTPAPWTVTITGMRGHFSIKEAQEHEAKHADDGVDGYTVSRANANLIAAAPELLQAAINVRDYLMADGKRMPFLDRAIGLALDGK